MDDPGASEDGVIRERGFSSGPLSARTSTAQNINTKGRPTMKIGFIGLGIMGRPMALNLKSGGHDLIVPERASLTAEIRAAAEVVADGKSVAAKSDVVVIIVPDTPDVEAVLFGAGGVAEGLKKGTLVIDMSSISPIATKEFAKKINALGCDYVDAPVSGGEVGAKQATLTIMAGGPDAAFARAKPLFDLMGKNITHVGPANGDGQTCKVANQIIVALNIQAVAEALVFASKAGADPAKVRQALMGGFASSRILEVHAERMLNGTFNPGFRIRLHQKDLNLALSAAKDLQLSLPNTAIAQQMFASCMAHGGGDLDHSAMILAVEGMAKHAIRG
jgi:2-hydroxy-3-oxopropionate reductase